MKPNLSATPEEPTLSTAAVTAKPKQQPSVTGDDFAPVGFVTVLLLTETPTADPQVGPEESPEESPEENPAETKLDSKDWLLPSPGSGLPSSGLVWVNGEDNDHAVSSAEVTAVDPSFEEKRKHILAAYLRGESNFDYDGLSPLGAHCCKQLVIWLQTSDSKQWNLRRANLYGANLYGANLSGANLYGANLIAVNLSGANLRNANLEGANLTNANLEDADLTGLDLTGADLTGAYLKCANLKGANLRNAFLTGAGLKDANLEDANLEGANLYGASEEDYLSPEQREQVTFDS